jgi:uncharacterized repeat protein (TIGR01451 family)
MRKITFGELRASLLPRVVLLLCLATSVLASTPSIAHPTSNPYPDLSNINPVIAIMSSGVANSTLPSGTLASTAAVTATTDSDLDTVQVIESADLGIVKAASPATPVVPGDLVTYTLTYSNSGTITATYVAITDIIPISLTNVTFVSSGALITPTSGVTYTWQVAPLATNEGGIITITGRLDPTRTWGSSSLFTNTATIATATTETNLANNTSTVTTTVQTADVVITKSGPSTVFPGYQLIYTLLCQNLGPAPATNVLITDTLPVGVTYAWDTSVLSPTVVGQTVVWTVGTLAGSQSDYFSLVVNVSPTIPIGTFFNSVTIGTQTPESNYANNQATCSTVVQAADVTVSKTVPSTVKPNRPVTYTISYANVGNIVADNVVVTDTLPNGVSYASANPTPSSVSWPVLTWNLGSLNLGGSGIITLVGNISPSVPSQTVLTNTLQIGTSTPESNKSNNQALATTTVIPDVPYTVTVSAYPSSILVGGAQAIITATVLDQYGNPVADGTPVTFTASLGVIVPASRPTTNGVATATLTSGYAAGTATVTAFADGRSGYTYVTFWPGAPFTVTVTINPSDLTVDDTALVTSTVRDYYGNPVANNTLVTFTVSAGGSVVPPTNMTSNGLVTTTLGSRVTGLITVTAMTQGDGGLKSGTATATFRPGAPATVTLEAYPLSIPVDGATATITATITDQYSNRVADGTAVAFTTTLGTINPLATITAGGVATATLTSGALNGIATVTATAGSRSGSVPVTFLPADLAVSMTAVPTTAEYATPGDVVTFTLVYTNNPGGIMAPGLAAQAGTSSGAVARNVVLQDILTSGLTDAHFTAYPPITPTPGITYSWNLGDLAPGQGGMVTITARVDPNQSWGTSEDVYNNASITSTTADGNPGNNYASQRLTVWTTNIYVNKYASYSTVNPNDTLTYRVSYGCDGPAEAAAVRITDTLPISTTWFYDNAPDNGFTRIISDPSTIIWTRDVLTRAAEFQLTLMVDAHAPGGAVLTNTATISTRTWERDYSDNRAVSTPAVIVQGADLNVSKTATLQAIPGATITYTISYSNTGTANINTLTISDTLPNGVLYQGASSPPTGGEGQWRTWTFSSLSPNTRRVFTVTGQLTTSVPSGTILTNTVEGSVVGGESYTGNNRAQAATAVIPGDPNLVTVTVAPASLPVGGVATATVTATVRDMWGNRVADGTLVTFGTNLGVGVNPGSWPTMGGVATTTITAGTTAGVATISASAGAAVGLATVNLLPDAPYTVTLWAMPPRLTVEQTTTLFAAVTDRYTNPVADGTLVTILSSLGTINPLYPVPTANGVATATLRSDIVGTAVVTATTQGRVGTTSVIFDPGPPYTVSVTAYPTQLPADGSTTTTITATVIDHASNHVADNTLVTFTASLTSSFTLTPTVVGTTGGVATATLSSGVAGTVTVTATAGTATGTNSIIFTPTVYRVVVQAYPASCTVGQTANVTVTVTDQQGSPALDGTPVLFSLGPTGSITPALGFTAAGIATATLSSYVATTVTVTATVGTDFSQANVVFTPAGPFNISVTIVPDRLPAGGARATITACVTDRYSNPVADGTRVDFYVEDSGKGTISPLFGPTVQGCVTATFTSGQTLDTTRIFAICGAVAGTTQVTIVQGWWLYLPVLFRNYP